MSDLYWVPLRSGFRARQFHRAVDLGLPIPGTGHSGGWRYLRRPRCHGIYREEGRRRRLAHIEVDGVRLRGALHRPPTDFDDLPVRARWNRNWKRFRRTRWKA
jgi:hypothetical protein